MLNILPFVGETAVSVTGPSYAPLPFRQPWMWLFIAMEIYFMERYLCFQFERLRLFIGRGAVWLSVKRPVKLPLLLCQLPAFLTLLFFHGERFGLDPGFRVVLVRCVTSPQVINPPYSNMVPEREGSPAECRWARLPKWVDIETAAVVTILMGIFQLLLCASLIQTNKLMSKFFFLLPLVMGITIIAGGSFTMASKKYPNKLLLRGFACSNILGLLGSLVALCIYSYYLHIASNFDSTESCGYNDLYGSCALNNLTAYTWSMLLQLLIYDCAAVVLHFLLSVCAFRTLKAE
ncbi:uncharacterized protein si:dkey-9i23.16 [Cyprinodon tularosa]|uniref:uncharacterized protein si:dkey-9i23.16 n=1 Tax=Cyprinodon tularosa TaxID=77115 RepID=UPI0018E25EFF|nr:uncharacterized protein si:dkey-9i23.16 [Cyprinodon tularosa]